MKIYAMSLLAMSSVVAATCAFGGVAPVVVLPDSPTAVEKSAAEELAGELGKCLGEKPKVIAEADLAKEGGASCPATAESRNKNDTCCHAAVLI